MQRMCDHCGTTYEAKRSTSKFCSSSCRAKSHQGIPAVRVADLPPAPAGDGGLTAVTEQELRRVGRLDTVAGQSALVLARRLDAQTTDTGSAVAALVRELQATMEAALRGAASSADPIDELRRKRDQRRAAAG